MRKMLLAVLLFAVPAFAQSPCDGRITDQLAHPMDAGAVTKPLPGECYTDPVFGTRICRITNADPVEGISAVIKTTYNTFKPWNADGSLILLWHRGAGRIYELYQGDEPYGHVMTLPLAGGPNSGLPTDIEQIIWDQFDPNVLYYPSGYQYSTDPVPRLWKITIDPAAGTYTQVIYRSFETAPTNCPPTNPLSLGHGHDSALTNQMVGLSCGNVNSRLQFLYSISEDTVYGIQQSATPDSHRAPLPFRRGDGAFVAPVEQAVDNYFNVTFQHNFLATFEHQAMDYAGGKNVLNRVNFDQPPQLGSLVSIDMATGIDTVVIGPATGWVYPPSSTHVSLGSKDGAGWVAISSVGTSYGQTVLDNELYLGNTVTGEVCRIAHNRTWARARGTWGYWGEPHPQISEDGYRVLFTSDWMGSTTVDTYVVDLRNGTPPPPRPTYAATLTWVDNADNEDGFRIERAPSEVDAFVTIGSVAADVTTYVDEPITEGARWCWRLVAFNSGGESQPSAPACATASAPVLPPVSPSGVEVAVEPQ
jgi:hypothetical protein